MPKFQKLFAILFAISKNLQLVNRKYVKRLIELANSQSHFANCECDQCHTHKVNLICTKKPCTEICCEFAASRYLRTYEFIVAYAELKALAFVARHFMEFMKGDATRRWFMTN